MQTHTHTKCTETAQRVTFNYSSHAQKGLHASTQTNPALDFLNKLTWMTSSCRGGIPGKPLLFFYSSTPAKYFTVFPLFFFLNFFGLLQASQPSPVRCFLLCNSCISSHFIRSSLDLFFFLSYSLSPFLYS